VARGPDRAAAIDRLLIDFGPGGKGRLGRFGADRLVGREIEPAAAHVRKLVEQHIAHGAQFAGIAALAQRAGRGIAAPVGKRGKFTSISARRSRWGSSQGIVARLDADGRGIALRAKGIHGDGRIGHRLIGAIAQHGLNHRSPP
jgi:hypothetical protein